MQRHASAARWLALALVCVSAAACTGAAHDQGTAADGGTAGDGAFSPGQPVLDGDGGVDGSDGSAPASGWRITKAAASSSLWPVANAIDGDATTVWSSNTHATVQNTEWIAFWFDTFHSTNYIDLTTRFAGQRALGFPVEYIVNWSDGASWQMGRGYTHFVTPGTTSVRLTLPDAVNANGIQIVAKVLGNDGVGNDVFQLAEVGAGYDAKLAGSVYPPSSAKASSELWPVSNAVDGSPATIWSSVIDSSASTSEWIAAWWPQGFQDINYVELWPRYVGTTANGFPTGFSVNYSNGGSWVSIASYTGFPNPNRGDPIVLPLGKTVSANGIQIVTTQLGTDGDGNHVFQLADIAAGYQPGFAGLQFVGNSGAPGVNRISNVGSESVDRADQLGNWNFDARGIVIQPAGGAFQNIYAPSVVSTGAGNWNIYFGGWDGSATPNDRVWMTTTGDDFGTFGAHRLLIDHGAYTHVNNDSTLQVGPSDWRMAYTCYGAPNGNLNKPCYATSSDGVSWTPNNGSSTYLMNVTGYPNWSTANVNGGNVVYRDPTGLWHLFFVDFSAFHGVYHATGTDFIDYAYKAVAQTDAIVINDLKAFTYGGTTFYVGAYHFNTQKVWMTVSTSLDDLGPSQVIFPSDGAADQYIVAVGFVQDGSRIYGALYGAGAVSSLDENRIFARWLQKKVIFENAAVRWGDIEQGLGPNTIQLYQAAGDDVETGRFSVYDTDGATLLYVSPTVTMRAGDQWSYSPTN